MKTYYMRIKEKFISEIRLGNKKHEYRLADPERLAVKVGDVFVLVSNQDKRNFIKTTVKKITHYKGWEETIVANWKDFENIYPIKETALKECYNFTLKMRLINTV